MGVLIICYDLNPRVMRQLIDNPQGVEPFAVVKFPTCTVGGAGRVSVAKVQVGLLGSARVLQRDLERIAKRADTNSSEGLTFVLQGMAHPGGQMICPGPKKPAFSEGGKGG